MKPFNYYDSRKDLKEVRDFQGDMDKVQRKEKCCLAPLKCGKLKLK